MNQRKAVKSGRPPEYPIRVLELWIKCIENERIDKSAGWRETSLFPELRKSKHYKINKEKYQRALKPSEKALEKGIKRGVFFAQDSIHTSSQSFISWELSKPVISSINTDRFKEDVKIDFYNAVDTLVSQIKKGTWEEYYNPIPDYPTEIDIPQSLAPYRFQLRETEADATWFNYSGVGLQEYREDFYPKKAIRLLKVQIEGVWQERRGVAFFAGPAEGKTTAVSILLHEWEESDNNICFKILATQWRAKYEQFEELFHKHATNPNYKFIIVIEDIHLTNGRIERIDEILTRCKNVRLLMTSRYVEEAIQNVQQWTKAKVIESVNFPENYCKELTWSILEDYKVDVPKNRSKIKSLISEGQYGNVIYTFSEISRRFNIRNSGASWSEYIGQLIVACEDGTDIKDRFYWRWVFLFLSIFRKYEVWITVDDFKDGCKLYDSLITPSTIGKAYTYLI